jgi:glycosyltransferase involved in cell wall biosynthesis
MRNKIAQTVPRFINLQMEAIIRVVCRGVDRDSRLIRRFAGELAQTKVTHLLPNLEFLALYAAAARRLVPHRVRYLVTFQGYEVYANYARDLACEQELYARLAEAVTQSDWPAVAVSNAYCERVHREVGVPIHQLAAIPPGVPVGPPMDLDRARELVSQQFPEYRRDLPLIAYVGRLDSEKGLDLLLYAVRILASRGVPCQLAICGPTAFGGQYQRACAQIAENLRIRVLWNGYVSDELRGAIFRASHTVVYPSIHEEPFGMVPVEAMAQGTPVIVPDTGGVASVARVGRHEGGLVFSSWDSGDLADRIQSLIEQPALHARLSADAPHVAAEFSIAKLGDRVLDHLGLPHQPVTFEQVAPRQQLRRAA